MAGINQTLKNPSYLQGSTSMLMFFGSWGIWWSFFQLWLSSEKSGLGLSGAQVGTVFSVNSLATLVIMLFYGTMQDRLGGRRHLAIFVAALTALAGPFCIWVYRPLMESHFMLGVVVGAVFLSAGFLAGVGLLEALTERLSRRFGYEYGQARMWGSFGYALVALAAGFLFTIDPALNFWCGSVLGLVHLLTLVLWAPAKQLSAAQRLGAERAAEAEVMGTPGLRDMLGLMKLPSLWLIIVFVMFSWTFYTVFDQQMFPEFYVGLFDEAERGQQIYGMLNAAQVFVEAAMMGLIPILMRKVGVRNALLLGVGVMFIRILGCSVLEDPIAVSMVKMLHAIETPLFILPIFRYFTLHFNPALSATLYMVGFQVSAQIGNVLMSTPLGYLHDQIGYRPTFVVIAGVVLLAGIFAALVLRKDDEMVLGDPFIRDGQSAVPPQVIKS